MFFLLKSWTLVYAISFLVQQEQIVIKVYSEQIFLQWSNIWAFFHEKHFSNYNIREKIVPHGQFWFAINFQQTFNIDKTNNSSQSNAS